ncbi:50S ribosomal protein L6 [Candidatus Woesearchaeota archaeon]|nr:50S ribosomal protein L6 [Candidatus Woesearchaeota archaeon]
MKIDFEEKILIPEGVKVEWKGNILCVEGPKGKVERELFHPSIQTKINDSGLFLYCKKATKREKTLLYAFNAHIKNMIKGVQKLFVYKLKACTGPPQSHFPAQISVKDNVFIVKNFLGEKYPRVLKIKASVSVKIDGNVITVESPDIESAGNTASNIELLTRISRRDRRIFQDGIYIIETPKGEIASQ